MNIVNIGCGPGKDECFFFVKCNEKFLVDPPESDPNSLSPLVTLVSCE